MAAAGKLVALEGDTDTISTQLRLLPPSQKILVLPSLLEKVSTTDRHSFSPRAYVREVHEAYTSRIEAARSFLEPSTTRHPRLVLMNGGSVGARTACIASICQNITHGDVEKAEAIFDDIVRDGVEGLLVQDEEPRYAELNDTYESVEKAEESEEDPTVKAMKAADSLDRLTAALQDSIGDDSEMTVATPTEGAQKEVTVRDPHEVIQSATEAVYKDDIRTTEITIPDHKATLADGMSTFGGAAGSHAPFSPPGYRTAPDSSMSVDDDKESYDSDLVSPLFSREDTLSVPPTPRVEYGEACIMNVQSTLAKNRSDEIRKTRSMEELSQGLSRPQMIILLPRNLRHSKSAYPLGERPTSTSGRIEDPDTPVQLPREPFVASPTTTIRKSQDTLLSELSSSRITPIMRIFVDRGSDAFHPEASEEAAPEGPIPYEPVFPALEDLVIQCVNDSPNEILTSVFQSYRNGTCPAMPAPDSSVSDDECPRTPMDTAESVVESDSHEISELEGVGIEAQNEFDPYFSDNYYHTVKQNIPRSKFACVAREPTLEPPSPVVTLRTPGTIVDGRFCEFPISSPNNVIDIQNSLRAFLGGSLPAGEVGYTQYYSPSAPEADRLWKPVFRNDRNAITGDEGRTVDQIIALGCEDGVKKEFFSQISGQVERLGTKRDGLSRSGRLDLRYLISSALQSVAAQPIAARSSSNSPDNSTLATLLVPHIETYLATNSSVQFLILLYPSSHLSTVIALRRLLGQDVLKIAGIVDTLSSKPPRTPHSHPLSNDSTSRLHRRRESQKSTGSQASYQSKESEPSFSTADYLLPSTATDAEISTFLSGIQKSLAEKSAFYHPEPKLEPVVVEKIVERIVERKPVPPPKPVSRLAGNAPDKRGHSYGLSASTIRSMTTVRTVGTARTTATERGRREDRAWENFYIGEVDSDDDEYDRMVMGRSGERIVPEPVRNTPGNKRSSKKALKWLGLS